MFRPGQHPPATFVQLGQDWPDGDLTDDAPIEAIRTQELVARVRAVLEEQSLSIRQAAAQCGVTHPTLVRLLNGSSYPDVATLARLESGLQAPLWGSALSDPGRLGA